VLASKWPQTILMVSIYTHLSLRLALIEVKKRIINTSTFIAQIEFFLAETI
jgi:hypothetical protein